MSYLAFDLDALKMVPDTARTAGVDDSTIGYGLVRLWQYCWLAKTDQVKPIQLSGFFPCPDQDKLICAGRKPWTVPVASFEANPYGLHDMLGSVWEWVADCSHNDYVGAPSDGSAWVEANCSRYLVRGGAFHSEFWIARAATRGAGLNPDSHPVASGFRVARDLD